MFWISLWTAAALIVTGGRTHFQTHSLCCRVFDKFFKELPFGGNLGLFGGRLVWLSTFALLPTNYLLSTNIPFKLERPMVIVIHAHNSK